VFVWVSYAYAPRFKNVRNLLIFKNNSIKNEPV